MSAHGSILGFSIAFVTSITILELSILGEYAYVRA